jgi:hypothetical protein
MQMKMVVLVLAVLFMGILSSCDRMKASMSQHDTMKFGA